MEKKREDATEYVDAILALDVGGSAAFPLTKINTIRNLRYFNPQILEARAEGREWKISPEVSNKRVLVTRIA